MVVLDPEDPDPQLTASASPACPYPPHRRYQEPVNPYNLDTGKTFTIRNGGTFRDQNLTVNDDGTLTVSQQFAGNQVSATIRGFSSLTLGCSVCGPSCTTTAPLDNADDDVVIEETTPIFEKGPSDTPGHDFCTDLFEFTA